MEVHSVKDLEVFKKTSDDWCPNFSGGYVTVAFYHDINPTTSPKTLSRVCVWGEDDCGMEYDGEEAWLLFLRICSLKDVTIRGVKELGLYSA